jgi:dynactin complex subunit
MYLSFVAGKNDGSVGGEVYFHCAANHGVFSRQEFYTEYLAES